MRRCYRKSLAIEGNVAKLCKSFYLKRVISRFNISFHEQIEKPKRMCFKIGEEKVKFRYQMALATKFLAIFVVLTSVTEDKTEKLKLKSQILYDF